MRRVCASFVAGNMADWKACDSEVTGRSQLRSGRVDKWGDRTGQEMASSNPRALEFGATSRS